MKRDEIKLKDGKFIVNGRPIVIYSGEMHYFRIPRDKWADRIKKAKESGLNTVSTYIPWSWHEEKEGKFDFAGRERAEKDLNYFIKLIKDAGLYMIARVGPTSNAEIKGEGTPLWFLENYQEARAKNRKGAHVPHEAMISYMHPAYQNAVSKWYNKLLPIVKKNQLTHKGPIIMVQLDNEIGMMNWVMNDPDYNEETTKLYGEFLKEIYKGDLLNLNDKYYTNHIDFTEIPQPKGDVDEEGVVRCWDWLAFYRDFYARFYRSLADRASEAGIDVPLSANIPMFWDYNICARADQGLMNILQFREFCKYVPAVIFGGAYQMRNLNFENFHDAIIMTEGIRMVKDRAAPIFCAEVQVGGMNDRPRIYPSDINLLLRYTLGHGITGLNAYMFAGGVNPEGMGFRGSYHEWQSPLDSKGKKTPRLKPIEDIGLFLETFAEPLAEAKTVHDISIGLYAPYYETNYLKGSVVENMTASRNRFLFDGVARLLLLNGFNFDFVDIEKAKPRELEEKPAMVVFSLDYMDRDTQLKLSNYVKSGGTLIMLPGPPTKNLGLLREEVFLKEMEVGVAETVKERLVYVLNRDYYVEGEIKIFDSKKRRVVAKTKDKKPCGILKKVKKGKLLLLGFGITHTLDYHISLFSHFLQMLNIEPAVKLSSYDVHAVMKTGRKSGFLNLSNFNDEPKEVSVNLKIPGLTKSSTIPQERKILLPNRSSYMLPLELAVAKNIKIRYSTAEILKVASADKTVSFTVHGAASGYCEMVLEMKKPAAISVDAEEVAFKHKDKLLKFSFELTGRKQEVLIET